MGELLHVAQRTCDEDQVASTEDAREVAEDPIVEVAMIKPDIASGKEHTNEEDQEYLADQDQIFKDLEKA